MIVGVHGLAEAPGRLAMTSFGFIWCSCRTPSGDVDGTVGHLSGDDLVGRLADRATGGVTPSSR
jgi:hypothetical protein